MNNHRNNRLLLLAGMALILVILSLVVTACIRLGDIGPVPVDVVMVDNELFFVLEKEYEINDVWVFVSNPTGKTEKVMWGLSHDPTTEVKTRKYPRLKQIKYGQKFEEFTEMVIGPFELQRNVEYEVGMSMRPSEAHQTFIITSDNKVIMLHPRFERQKNRTYSVSIDENGNKILVPEPISNGEVK